MNKKHWLTAVFCIAAMYGCEDETGSTTSYSTPAGGCDPSLCASGECLPSGECKPVTDPGPGPGPEPCEGEDCPQEITYLNKGDKCLASSATEICKSPLFCHNGRCIDQDDASLGKSCESSDDCADQDPFTICMDNNHCGYYAEVGEKCRNVEGGTVKCAGDAVCQGSCALTLNEGDPCDSEDVWRSCNATENNFCIDGTCKKYTADLPRGAACDNSYRFCATNLECLNGSCTETAGEEEACAPADHLICPPTMECLNGKCTPIVGKCTSTSDCTEKDSFCCTTESCGAIGSCIPYNEEVTHDEMCRFKTKPGIFEAQVQCRWQPPADDQWPSSKKVEMPPLIGHFGNKDNIPTTIAVYSFKSRGREKKEGNNNPITEAAAQTVIRFINPENCETLESIKVSLAHWWDNYPAAADLDGDGYLEFITSTLKTIDENNVEHHVVAYKWNNTLKKHEVYWTSEAKASGALMVYDVNADGKPDVVAGTTVLNGQTGKTITSGSEPGSATWAVGNFDNDPKGYASLLNKNGVYKWDSETKKWVKRLSFSGGSHTAYADFGTPGSTAAKFDFTKLDGKPEYVLSGGDKLLVFAEYAKSDGTVEVQEIMNVTGYKTGGPVTIGDFDNDGLPEIGIASAGLFGVYDPRCTKVGVDGCADKYVLWERWSQDASSGATGSSLFDFDGDGQSEAVYADECFTRVYDGKTGKVLFSARRSSSTSIEAPVIADVDNDGSAEILMGSDNNQTCYNDNNEKLAYDADGNNAVDPIHEGIRCTEDADCPTKKCDKDLQLCICTKNSECNTQIIKNPDGSQTTIQQYICTAPIHKDVGFMRYNSTEKKRVMVKAVGTRPDGWKSSNGYKVCRATRKYKDIGDADLMILKDRLDRWVSSRNLWNQHAYNIINIEDNGKLPTAAKWLEYWTAKLLGQTITGTGNPRPKYNNYRLNSQGEYGAGMAPDITGRFTPGSICGTTADGRHVISAKLCNRGTKSAGKDLPATFFYYDEDKPDHRGDTICTSYTKNVFGVGECDAVGCEITEEELKNLEGKKVLMVVNLDEFGHESTVECNASNNTDVTTIDTCESNIVIAN